MNWSKDKVLAMPELTQDFDKDFDEITLALRQDYAASPYAFLRFGDGEAAIMQGNYHKAKSDGWQASEVHPAWIHRLTSALHLRVLTSHNPVPPAIYYGISSEEHHGGLHDFYKNIVGNVGVTFAEIFSFANWKKTKNWDLSKYRIVHQNAEHPYKVPAKAVLMDWDVAAFANDLVLDDDSRPILVSAGPVAKSIIDYYVRYSLQLYGELKSTIIDVGSCIDPFTRGRPTRRFHRGVDADWKPKWELPKPEHETPDGVNSFVGEGAVEAPKPSGDSP